MRCPKCNVESETRFCSQCGLDLGVYQELSALRVDLEALRLELSKFPADPSRRPAAPLAEPSKIGERDAGIVRPPPLPAIVRDTVLRRQESRPNWRLAKNGSLVSACWF